MFAWKIPVIPFYKINDTDFYRFVLVCLLCFVHLKIDFLMLFWLHILHVFHFSWLCFSVYFLFYFVFFFYRFFLFCLLCFVYLKIDFLMLFRLHILHVYHISWQCFSVYLYLYFGFYFVQTQKPPPNVFTNSMVGEPIFYESIRRLIYALT